MTLTEWNEIYIIQYICTIYIYDEDIRHDYLRVPRDSSHHRLRENVHFSGKGQLLVRPDGTSFGDHFDGHHLQLRMSTAGKMVCKLGLKPWRFQR